MGYSNYFIKAIIRRFVNLLINKHTIKVFLFVLILGLILLKICNNTTFAVSVISDTTYYDGYEANINDMNALQNDFIVRLEGLGTDSIAKNDFMTRIQSGEYALFIYYGDGQGNDYNNTRPVLKKNTISLFLMPITQLSQLSTEYRNWGLNGEVICWRYKSNATYYEYKFVGNAFTYNTLSAGTAGHWYPSYLLNYKNDNLTQYIISYFQGDTSKVIDAIQNNSNNIINNQNENTNTIVNNQKENTDKIINEVTNDEIDEDIVSSLPSNEFEDTTGTDNYISDLFNLLYNNFTDDTPADLYLTIPNTNKSFIINYNSLYGNFWEENTYTRYLKNFIQLVYWYIIGMYVLKDISKKVNKIKTGNIENIQSGNIKEDLL